MKLADLPRGDGIPTPAHGNEHVQTLGLTTTTMAATDAGADSATQTGAAASAQTGAIFDILMASAVAPSTDGMVNNTDIVAAPPVDAVDAADATKALAADMEKMVQALAITAGVVANGMAARTMPVREIILTAEAPVADAVVAHALPELSVTPPVPTQGPELKISDADPAKNLDPALLLLLPVAAKTKPTDQTNEVEPSKAPAATDLLIPQAGPVPAALEEMPAPQALSATRDEPHGPWRAEIYGPVLGPDRKIVTEPVHIAITEAPLPAEVAPVEALPLEVQANDKTSIAQTPLMVDAPAHDHDKTVAPTMIRVLTVNVPVGKTTEIDATDEPATSDDVEAFSAEPQHHAEPRPEAANLIPPHAENLPPQTMLIVPADRQLDQPARVDQAVAEASTDVLEAPHRVWQQMPVVITAPTLPSAEQARARDMTATPHGTNDRTLSADRTEPGDEAETFAPTPQGFALPERTKPTLRQALPHIGFATAPDTNITSGVANSSSRSSANIRDLVKLGVRDIEITHGTGTEQAGNVSPHVQMVPSDGVSSATRTQVADAFAPAGNDAGNADRRAQAHEIRLRAIERQVIAAVRDGADTIRMQLYPPGLGQIIIRLTMDGSKLKMTTKASSVDAADSLRSIEGDLREALSTGGLELAGFDVSDDGERDGQRRARPDETEETKTNPRSAKSENFALDMNA